MAYAVFFNFCKNCLYDEFNIILIMQWNFAYASLSLLYANFCCIFVLHHKKNV